MVGSIMTQHKMVDNNLSTVDKEVGIGGMTSYFSTLKDHCPKGETSESTYVDEKVSNGSPGSEVSDDIQVRKMSVGAKRNDAPTRSIEDHFFRFLFYRSDFEWHVQQIMAVFSVFIVCLKLRTYMCDVKLEQRQAWC